MVMYLLFDVGGTKTRMAVWEKGEPLKLTSIVDTPQSFEEGTTLIKQLGYSALKNGQLKGLCMAIAGPLDPKKEFLLEAPHLPDWKNKPLKARLHEVFGCPVLLENDAALAGLGEALHGTGQGYKIVAYMTVSTGVGGVKIVNGKIDQSAEGFEPGHQIIGYHDDVAVELEQLVSGTALEKHFKKKPEEIKDERIWSQVAKNLAVGLNNIVLTWSPDIIVLGGSLMESIPLEKVKLDLKQLVKIFPLMPKVVKGQLGDLAAIYGGMEYLKNNGFEL